MSLLNALPGACAQGLIWGIMAIGVYITYKILDLADLTVDGTMATGGAVCIMMIRAGHSLGISLICAVLAGALAGLVTGIFHTSMGIPAILAGILTQLGLYSVNLRILGNSSNQAVGVDKYDLLVSLRYIKGVPFYQNTILICIVILIILIALLYWFFGTELGCSIRATGSNPNMSRAQGINTNFCKILGLMLSNGIVAFASALYAQYQGFADVNMGRGAIIFCRNYRRGNFQPRPWKFCFQAVFGGIGSHYLLYCPSGGAVARSEFQRSEAVLRPGGGPVPGYPLFKGKVLQ